MRIFLNAGHNLDDVGAVGHGFNENEMNVKLRDRVFSMIKEGSDEIIQIPDELNLRESIDWVNERAEKEDMAISIHFNSNQSPYIHGTEAYYSNDREREMAIVFAQEVSRSLGFRNRGARHDSWTWVGSLGWLRKLKCDSVLVEVCYLTNESDMIEYSIEKAARGFVQAISEAKAQLWKMPSLEELQSKVALLQRLVDELIRLLALLKNII